jgi:phosphonate metabolism protein (transferase hexapeptide repeat family)
MEVGREVRMYESELGRYSYCMERCQFDFVTVGKFTSVASDVRLGPAEHPTERPTQHHMTYRRARYDLAETDGEEVFARRREQPVAIGHDVWIGHSVTVMPGVTIGTGAVVGAGAVVTTDVDPYDIVAGVPAESISRRFDEETAERLLEMQWWDWSRDTIEKRFADFRDLRTFIENTGELPRPTSSPLMSFAPLKARLPASRTRSADTGVSWGSAVSTGIDSGQIPEERHLMR